MISEIKIILSQFANKDFVAVAGGHLLFWGMALGVICFAVALWWWKDSRAQLLALLLIILSSATIYPVVHWRPKTAPKTVLKEDVTAWQTHTVILRKYEWVFYAMAGCAAATLAMRSRGGLGDMLCALTIAAGVCVTLYALWIYQKEILLHYPAAELRPGDPRLR